MFSPPARSKRWTPEGPKRFFHSRCWARPTTASPSAAWAPSRDRALSCGSIRKSPEALLLMQRLHTAGQGAVEAMHGVDGHFDSAGPGRFICPAAGDGEAHTGCALLIEPLPEKLCTKGVLDRGPVRGKRIEHGLVVGRLGPVYVELYSGLVPLHDVVPPLAVLPRTDPVVLPGRDVLVQIVAVASHREQGLLELLPCVVSIRPLAPSGFDSSGGGATMGPGAGGFSPSRTRREGFQTHSASRMYRPCRSACPSGPKLP